LRYDIIVIGAGAAGLNIASFMNTLKLKVLLVEKHLIGGDCLNFGCVPSKVLLSLAHSVDQSRKAEKLGFHIEGTIDMNKVAGLIAARQEHIRIHENRDYLEAKGIDVEIGLPRFLSAGTIQVNNKVYRGKKFVIATGSRPSIPPIPGLEKIDYFTNETIFANRELPGTFLIIGAGPIGIEMAQAYSRLGAKVVVVDLQERILPKEDEEISQILLNYLQKEGIRFRLGVKPLKFLDQNRLLIRKEKPEKEEILTFDRVLIAAGRLPNVEGLDLHQAGIETANNRLCIDKYLRTTNKRIYCCGDVAGGYLFTHWAEYQAAIVITNMLSPFKKTIDPSAIAWVTFTEPEIATFGLHPSELIDRGIPYNTIIVPLKELDRAICEGFEDGLLKVHLSKGKIKGGTLLAKNAGELIGELIAFKTLKISFSRLYRRIYPYPTLSRIHRKAVQRYLGEKLTPWKIGVLNKLFKLFNK